MSFKLITALKIQPVSIVLALAKTEKENILLEAQENLWKNGKRKDINFSKLF